MTHEHEPTAHDPFENAAVLDARSLRGLAHPLRMRVYLLIQKRPATGKSIAERLDISSASASYHLRQLESYGFIEEDTSLGHSRERWWRAVHQGFRLPERLDTEAPELTTALRHALAAGWSERLGAAVNLWSAQPERWREAQFMADRTVSLTLEQMERFRAEVIGLLDRYADEGGTDERTVNVQFAAFPTPGPENEPETDVPPVPPGDAS
ncbi:transcriptional regulator [Nocardiopsis sp. MG754419]|uniref:ArsR/SmtB family transcription factor n=1 Tax=Nocardiopsis sp. MG754419 TaxID=2259865 RepID=UPI001BA8A402|nr:helix-turn-helix domain-containing protein [Nocardiopsis sp. MG754419]MBR8742065.1 ArsR family transcriptional regulator [Nocardiopsis sp. MG754419]